MEKRKVKKGTRVTSKSFREGWDRIYGKQKKQVKNGNQCLKK